MTSVGNAPRPVAEAAGRLPSVPRVHRSEEGRVVAGVASGIAHALGADPVLVRLVFAILALAGGSGIVLYLAAWLFLPPPGAAPESRRPAAKIGGLVLIRLSGLLALHGLGLDHSVVPAALIAGGVILVSRRAGRPGNKRQLALGFLLVMAGTLVYVNETAPFGENPGPVAPGAVAIAMVAIVAPWLWRLARDRDAERLERIRSEERAEIAARVHDSVLQTLALIQRHAGDERQVATLARQQERDLRGWLYGGRDTAAATLVAALETVAADVERLHGAVIELVSTGDRPLDERGDALVLAAREAMTNAAKFSGAETIYVYVEARTDGTSVFVRDRGAGFDPAAVPTDRAGIRESIEARMARHGGNATLTSEPGVGTEVELTMPAGRR